MHMVVVHQKKNDDHVPWQNICVHGCIYTEMLSHLFFDFFPICITVSASWQALLLLGLGNPNDLRFLDIFY